MPGICPPQLVYLLVARTWSGNPAQFLGIAIARPLAQNCVGRRRMADTRRVRTPLRWQQRQTLGSSSELSVVREHVVEAPAIVDEEEVARPSSSRLKTNLTVKLKEIDKKW